jgi:hypothetical protein
VPAARNGEASRDGARKTMDALGANGVVITVRLALDLRGSPRLAETA